MHGSPSSPTPRGTPSRRGKSPRFSSDNQPLASSSAFPINFTNKPVISSLHIPVQGAISIDPDTQKKSGFTTDATPSTSGDSKRAPRKSKTDALAALNNHARSPSIGPEDIDFSEDFNEKFKNATPISVAPFLDLSSVKTPLPRSTKQFPRPPRPFELTDCPEFFPTVEEFKDPMTYIKSISSEAKAYGICKIIPPDDWKMPFVTNTEVCVPLIILSHYASS